MERESNREGKVEREREKGYRKGNRGRERERVGRGGREGIEGERRVIERETEGERELGEEGGRE